MSGFFRPRRSCLYIPGINSRALEKARGLHTDCLLIDLEDAVAPDSKESARAQACDLISQKPFGHREVVLRINGRDTAWFEDDLTQAVAAGPDAILVPKVMSADDILFMDDKLSTLNAPPNMTLWAMIEVPQAILRINDIAATASASRLSCFVMGTNDLAKELSIPITSGRFAFMTALSLTVMAAKAFGVSAIDGVFNDIADGDGFALECTQGLELGFDGKSLIHPKQTDDANRVFSPTPEAVAEARAVVAAFELAENAGKGVIVVDGKMTELLHLERAQQLVAKAAAIESLPAS
ncbi:MAG: CoA ester lyase [Pseudomonadota bacterium]